MAKKKPNSWLPFVKNEAMVSAEEKYKYISKDIETLRNELYRIFVTKEDKVDLIEKMNKDKIDLIKWMFGFWITIILLLLANWFLK